MLTKYGKTGAGNVGMVNLVTITTCVGVCACQIINERLYILCLEHATSLSLRITNSLY